MDEGSAMDGPANAHAYVCHSVILSLSKDQFNL
jgi:hypothetical protein